jgi:hypothetical protein
MSEAAHTGLPPAARVDDNVAPDSEAEAIRRAHIAHEASIKAVGFLYYLGGVLLAIGALASLFTTQEEFGSAAVALLLAAVAASQLAAGWGVRGLRKWGQVVGCVLSALGLLAFPVGTLINLYVLYLLLSKKGRSIFSPEYREVVAATPHVKYKTSILVWIFLALLVALVVAAVAVPMFAK